MQFRTNNSLLKMHSYPSFNDLADQIKDQKDVPRIMSRQQKTFQLQSYKVTKLNPKTAKELYRHILNKYQTKSQQKISQNNWIQGQRRAFVWYLAVFIDLYAIPAKEKNSIDWDALSEIFFGKNPRFLQFQFINLFKVKSKVTWNQEQDEILLAAMQKQKQGMWNQVSKRIYYESGCKLFKSAKQCRQRWLNHLDQSKNRGQWSVREDYTLFKYAYEHGNKYAQIVKVMGKSRTEHMIKNRYNSLIMRQKKMHKTKEVYQSSYVSRIYHRLEKEIKLQRKQIKQLGQLNAQGIEQTQIVQQGKQLIKIQQNSEKISTQQQVNSAVKTAQIKDQNLIKGQDSFHDVKIQQECQIVKIPQSQTSNNYKTQINYELKGSQAYHQMLYFYHPSSFVPVKQIYESLKIAE